MDRLLKSMTFDFFGKGLHKIVPERMLKMEDAVLLDVRSHEEVRSLQFSLAMHSKVTSLHVPIDEVPDRIGEIPKDKTVAVFCPQHMRASMVYFYLRSSGYEKVRVLEGGYAAMAAELTPGKIVSALQE